jgi:hypothetical protein
MRKKPSIAARLRAAAVTLGAVFSGACAHEWKAEGVQFAQRKGHRAKVGFVSERCAMCGDRRTHYGTVETRHA